MNIKEWQEHARSILRSNIVDEAVWDEVTAVLLRASETEGLPLLDELIKMELELFDETLSGKRKAYHPELYERRQIAIAGLRSGSIQTARLAMQIAGYPVCDNCWYVKEHCRCT
jgi:hypothetical protein